MDFANDAHAACYERVRGFMTQLFGEEAAPDATMPSVVLRRGSADVHVSVVALGEETVVSVFAFVATGVTASEDLCRYLLSQNADFVFGAYGLNPGNTVVYQHSVVGDSVDKRQLRTSVHAVADVADGYDEQITSRFGGATPRGS